MPRLLHLAAFALAVLGVAGCHHREIEEDELLGVEAEALADDAMDSNEASARGVALSRLFFINLDPSTISSPKKAFDRVLITGDKLSLVGGFLPIKCVRAAAAPSAQTVRLSFSDCHGPFGVTHLSGAVDGTFQRPDGNSLQTHIESVEGLSANGQPLRYSADSFATIDGSVRDLTLHSTWSGVTRKGHEVEHTSDLSVLIDTSTGCVDISGTTRGTVEGRTTETLIDGYRACPHRCPAAGSITSTSKKTGRSIVVRYDGTTTALITTPRGSEFAAPLLCDTDE